MVAAEEAVDGVPSGESPESHPHRQGQRDPGGPRTRRASGAQQVRWHPHEETETRPVREAESEGREEERAVREGGPQTGAERRGRLTGHVGRTRQWTRLAILGSRQDAEILGTVPGEQPDHHGTPEEQEDREPQDPAPREPREHERRRSEGHHRREAGREVEDAERPAALARRPPGGDEPAGRREAHRLRCTVQGPGNRETPEAPAEAREPVQDARAHGAERDQAPAAHAIREVPAHELSGPVEDQTGAADPADLGGAQPQLGPEPRNRPAEVLPAGVVDEIADARREEHPPLRTAERGGRRLGGVYAGAPDRGLTGPRARRQAPVGTAARSRPRRGRAPLRPGPG